MKKAILTVAAIFAFGFANAQDKKESTSTTGFASGDVFVEGAFTFDSTNDKNTETKMNGMAFMPTVGYFLNDKFAVGIKLNIGSHKTEVAGVEVAKTNNFGVGAFGRYYCPNFAEKLKIYTQFGFDMNTEKDGVGATVKTNEFKIGVGLGMNYFVTPKLAVSFGLANMLAYESTKTDAAGDKGENGFHANLNIINNIFNTPTFGMLYKF